MASESSPAAPAATARFRRWEPRDLAPLVSFAALVLFLAMATGFDFLRVSTAVNVLKQGSDLLIVAVGLTFVLLCAEIDLAVGMIALWTASLCGWAYQSYIAAWDGTSHALGVAAIVALPLASAVALGAASGTLTVWARLPSFIITLAMMYIAQGASRWLTQSETYSMPLALQDLGNAGPGAHLFADASGRGGVYLFLPYKAILAAAVAIVAHVVLQHTRFGRYVYMTGGNREAARLSGVRTGLIVVACLAISSGLAGLGGLINAGTLQSVSQDQNADLLLNAVACVVLGGTSLFGGEGGVGRTVLGVLTFTSLQVGLDQISWIDDLARQALMGGALLLALVVNGLLARHRV
jgi:ribose transport system permease protein